MLAARREIRLFTSSTYPFICRKIHFSDKKKTLFVAKGFSPRKRLIRQNPDIHPGRSGSSIEDINLSHYLCHSAPAGRDSIPDHIKRSLINFYPIPEN